MSKKCSHCNESVFKIYPNKICQRCLSLRLENDLTTKNKQPKLTAEYLITEYIQFKKSISQISRDSSVSKNIVKKCLQVYRIPIRSAQESLSKTEDKHLFVIDSAEKAFLLGYIFTDGDLVFDRTLKKHYLKLYSKHRPVIETIHKLTKSKVKIQFRKANTFKSIIQSEIYFFQITDQVLIDDLINIGMTTKKNQDLEFPDIPERFYSHFIRGCWGGSGHVGEHNNRVISSLVVGSRSLLIEIESILNSQGLSKRKIYKNSHSKKPSFSIKYAHKESEKLYNILYRGKNNKIVLNRQEVIYKKNFKRKGLV